MRNIKKRLFIWAVVVGGLLCIPLIFNWPWTGSDYVFGGVVLFGSAAIFEFLTKNVTQKKDRVRIGIIVLLILIFIWVGAATGYEGIIEKF